LPNQREIRWSQLKVGLLVIAALTALTLLVSLMSGTTGGLFTRRIVVHSFFQNAGGLKPGAPVNLQGVTIGAVEKVLIIPSRKKAPVEAIMRIGLKYGAALHTDSKASLATAGVLGDTFVDIDSSNATGPPLQNGDELPVSSTPSLADVIKSTQGTVAQVNVILAKLNALTDGLNAGQGTLGKLLKDPKLYDRASGTLAETQAIVQRVNQGQGTLGKLVMDPEMYNRANDAITRLQKIADTIEAGQGTLGKLVKDDALYNNLAQTSAKANHLMDGIDAGQGTLGLLAKDQKFRQQVNATVTNLNKISSGLVAGEGTTGKLLHDPALYNNTNQSVVELRRLLAAIRANPKKYLVIRLRIF
jgi:phospholipid/cholesterol/gamma-HCH transport system substrate-binding protein